MPPSYPNTIKSFTTKTENDLVMEDHMNDVQSEITAEQTELGLLPKGAYASVAARLNAATAAIAMGAHFLIPALRSYWSCSACTYVSSVPYIVAPYNNGFNLTCYNAPQFGYTGITPWISFNGSNQYAAYADHQNFDILGTETHIAEPGLSLGSLVRFTNPAGSIEFIFGKRVAIGNQRSYSLRRLANGTLEFCISINGTAEQTVSTTTVTLENVWYDVVGVWDPSTRLSIFVNGVEENPLTTAVIASIYNSTALIMVGAENTTTNLLNGKLSQIWIAASNLGSTYPMHLFNQTRGLFGL